MINLKELRDQILGRKSSTNVVFGWGLHDLRLQNNDEVRSALINKRGNQDGPKSNNDGAKEDFANPKKMNFQSEVEIEKIECGDSYTIALDSKGQVWSWGIGKSGSLGLGEVLTATHEPSKIHFRQPKVADQNKEKR